MRKAGPSPALPSAVVRQGRHATFLVSSGFSDLDQIIGGGFPLGSLIMVIEDVNAPHHMLLLRYFMAQGLLHGQPLLFASSVSSPDAFLGTLPGVAKEVPDHAKTSQGEESLRIAWQYRKYLDEQQSLEDRRKRQEVSMSESQGISQEYCTTFDLKKPAARLTLSSGKVECVNLCAGTTLTELQEKCKKFFSLLSRPAEGIQQIGRIALQSLCAPQGVHFYKDWEMLAFLYFLKGLLRASNAVALLTFPASLLAPSFSLRWQHMADVLLSVEAIPDDNKDMAALIADYHDMVGLMRILKLPCINTQVPAVPDAAVHAIKFLRRKTLVLERLNQAPVDGSSGERFNKSTSSLLCSGPVSASSPLSF